MSFRGNLSDQGIIQIFNVIELAQKTGTLTVYRVQKDAPGNDAAAQAVARIVLYFKSGTLLHAAINDKDDDLLTALYRSGNLTRMQVQEMREEAGDVTDKALALRLIDSGRFGRMEVVASIQQNMASIVHNLMAWQEGAFHFEETLLLNRNRLLVPLDLKKIIQEGSKRKREVRELGEYLPDLNKVLVLKPGYKARLGELTLTRREWRVMAYVNTGTTIREIADANQMSDVEIRKIVHRLDQGGVLTLGEPLSGQHDEPDDVPDSGKGDTGRFMKRVTGRLKSV